MTGKKNLENPKQPETGDRPSGKKGTPGKASIGGKEPQTMEELLSVSDFQFKGLKRGEIIEGTIIEIAPKNLYIDISAKTPGVVLGKEYELIKEFVVNNLKVGDKVKAYVGNPENDRGQILLSLRNYIRNFAWNKYKEILESETETEVKGREVNKGGLIVDTSYGLQGFVPGSQLGSSLRNKLDQLIGKTLRVKTIEVDEEKNRLVFSEKAISDATKIAAIAKIIKKVKVGKVLEGEVTQIVPFGLFVKVKMEGEEVEGLVHLSEISWFKVEDLSKNYKVGDMVKVKVVSTEDNRLQFSIKQLLPDPWEGLEGKYTPEKSFSGQVVRLASYGALVELEPGIEGLLHISKIPPEFNINEGDKIEVFIDSVDKENRKISLGLSLKEKPLEYK